MSTGSIEGRPSVGVVGRQLAMHPGQVEHSGDLAHAMIVRNHLLKAERIEQLPLVVVEPPHHRPPPRASHQSDGESRFADRSNRLLQQNRHFSDVSGTTPLQPR